MSRTTKLAISFALAGMLIATFGLITNAGYQQDAAASQQADLSSGLDPVTGLASIDRVVAFWERRADVGPSDYLSRTQLGYAILTQARETADLDRYGDAEARFDEALALNPQHDAAQLGRAQSLHAQHRFGEAFEAATTVVATSGSPVAELLAADAMWELGQHRQAAETYSSFLAAQRTAPLLSRAAKVADLRGDDAQAITLAREALESASQVPQRPHATAFYHFQLAHFLNESGDTDAARTQLAEAVRIDPANPGATELLASLEHEAGNLEAAAELYDSLLEHGPAADLHGSFADIQRALGNADLARQHEELGMELALETIESQPAERRHVAEFFMTRDSTVAVELALRDLQERQDVGAWELLVRAHEANGDRAQAAQAQARVDALVDELRAAS